MPKRSRNTIFARALARFFTHAENILNGSVGGSGSPPPAGGTPLSAARLPQVLAPMGNDGYAPIDWTGIEPKLIWANTFEECATETYSIGAIS